MSATMFFEYPEFFLAALAGAIFFFVNKSSSTGSRFFLPAFITEPAVTDVGNAGPLCDLADARPELGRLAV